MSEVIDTFKRVEDKYLLTPQQAQEVRAAMRGHIHQDAYFRYTVHSLYYDSPQHDLVIRSLSKPDYKVKLRARCYEQPEDDTMVFLETKKKYDDIVYKKRIQLTEKEAREYTEQGIPHTVTGNTAEEIDYMMNYYHLEPAVLILYDRECWSSDTEKDVRITFDSNIRYRLDNVTLKETGEEKPLRKGMVIMEVKAMDRYPLWLVRILSENKLYKSSFSKYGTIYTETYGRPQNRTGRAYEYTGEKEKRLCSVQY